MDTKQRIVLVLVAGVVLLMVLFPPYVVKNYKGMAIEAGYGFLFALPPHRYEFGGKQKSIPATVNASQLAVQIGGVLIVGILVFAACKEARPQQLPERDK